MANAPAKPFPNRMSDALFVTVATPLFVHAGHRHQGLLDTFDNFVNTNLVCLPSQNITTTGTANTAHQTGTTQLDEDLLQKSQRDVLLGSYRLARNRTVRHTKIEADHGTHRVLRLIGDAHGSVPPLLRCFSSFLVRRTFAGQFLHLRFQGI